MKQEIEVETEIQILDKDLIEVIEQLYSYIENKPSGKFQLREIRTGYEDWYLALIETRLETDDEYNYRIEEEKKKELKSKARKNSLVVAKNIEKEIEDLKREIEIRKRKVDLINRGVDYE